MQVPYCLGISFVSCMTNIDVILADMHVLADCHFQCPNEMSLKH